MDLGSLIHGAALCFAVLLVIAAGHKIAVLARGAARYEPLVAVKSWRRRVASPLLIVILCTEFLVAGMLVVYPALGLWGMAGLSCVYLWALKDLPASASCNCFGSALSQSTRSHAMLRTAVIAVASLVGATALAGGLAEEEAVSGSVVGLALLFTSAVVSYEIATRNDRQMTTRGRRAF